MLIPGVLEATEVPGSTEIHSCTETGLKVLQTWGCPSPELGTGWKSAEGHTHTHPGEEIWGIFGAELTESLGLQIQQVKVSV